nr:hypothetical protein [Methanoculleus sp. FWC-SCC3]
MPDAMLHLERSGSTVRCDSLQRMEAQDEDFEARLRALEGWRAEKVGEEKRISTISAGAGGIVGGVVAVLVKVLGGG